METHSHYFDNDPSSTSRESSVDLVLPDLTRSLKTDTGVFSSKRIDAGTKFLLLEAPTPEHPPKQVLDLGCGYGPIAAVLEHRFPKANVWATDVNNRALNLSAENLTGANTIVCRPEEIPQQVRFDLIWSNPPVRIGKKKMMTLLSLWLERLEPSGSAVLVVNKNLGSDSLHTWMESEGWDVDRLKSFRGFRLLEVKRNA
ncbi:MAG: methyltransferase [Actinomycetota bacterium]